MRAKRDTQKRKVYKAETEAFGPHEERMTFSEAESYVNNLCQNQWTEQTFGVIRPKVNPGKRYRTARGSPTIVILPRWARNPHTIIHEVCHGLTRKLFGAESSWHGREYCWVYVKMVERFLGKANANDLKKAFKKVGVKYSLPRHIKVENGKVTRLPKPTPSPAVLAAITAVRARRNGVLPQVTEETPATPALPTNSEEPQASTHSFIILGPPQADVWVVDLRPADWGM